MIIDLPRFIAAERPSWTELEDYLRRFDNDPACQLSLEQVRRFHFLYERTAADLARMTTFAAEPELRRYLEGLVARAYGEMHETRAKQQRWGARRWLLQTWPRTFRRHIGAFYLAAAITLAGCLFGGLAMALDPEAKAAVLPPMFASHLDDPSERVAREESAQDDRLAGARSTFSAFLMRNNIRVSIFAMALGMTCGLGTILVLFYNGIILGLIALDYIAAGETLFLLGWLLPHGAIEIPAILIAGQAGFVLAAALIGRGRRAPLSARLRAVAPDLVTLIAGVALMLVWAGLVEAFLSQYHEPVLPYAAKVAFGATELLLLAAYLGWAGRGLEPGQADPAPGPAGTGAQPAKSG